MTTNKPVLSESSLDLDTPLVQQVNKEGFDEDMFFIEKALSDEEAWEANIDNE